MEQMQATPKFKILMLTYYFHPHVGGNENQCKILSETLANFGSQVIVITKRYKKSIPKFEIAGKINVIRIFCLSALYSESVIYNLKHKFENPISKTIIRILLRLYFYIDEFLFLTFSIIKIFNLRKEIDLIHVHQIHWIAFGGSVAARLSKVPLLVKDATLGGFKELKVMPFSHLMQVYILRTSNFVAISSDIESSLRTFNKFNKLIFSIPNGVIFPSLSNGISEENFDILFVGNFVQGNIKGLDTLLKSMPSILEEFPEARLIIIGNGKSVTYNEIIVENNLETKVLFLGNLDPKEYYLRSAVFVLPSRSEGMSNALLEAMSYGMPCISTKVSGSVDIISNRVNGILVDIDSATQISEANLLLLKDRNFAKEIGNNARLTIRNKYQINYIAKEYEKLYEEIIIRY